VAFLSKLKIHELAKELNVTSKRLMEKLNEINIYPKSHMSTLEPEEVQRLYEHIGVVNHDKDKGEESQGNTEPKAEHSAVSVNRNAPRIVRKTRVIIHDETSFDDQQNRKKQKTIVRKSDSNEGLLAGFTREDSDSPITGVRKRSKAKPKEKEEKKDPISILKAETERAAEKQVKPVDDIIGITRVIKRSDLAAGNQEGAAENKQVKEQEDMQRVIDVTQEKLTETEKETDKKKTEKDGAVSGKREEKADKAEVAAVEDAVTEVRKVEPETVKSDAVKADTDEKAVKADKAEKADKAVKAEDLKEQKSEEKLSVKTEPLPEGKAAPKKQGTADAEQKETKQEVPVSAKVEAKPSERFRQQEAKFAKGGAEAGQRDRQEESAARKADFRKEEKGKPGKNKQLVIPKASPVPGGQEEKVPTRGERRSFQSVDKEKLEKKEERKEERKAGGRTGAYQRGGNIRKKIGSVIGHKANVKDMMSDDFIIDTFYDDNEEAINAKRAAKKAKKSKQKEETTTPPPKPVLTDITIGETITVRELAEALKKTAAEVIKRLLMMGVVATQNQEIDFDTAAIIADEFGVKANKEVVVTEEDILFDESEDAPEDLEPRAPVVVVMGHVDHGKTSLLDAIRSSHVAEHEAGGITQHIGAYTVNYQGRDITFLDTPGHEAFTAMRARGAQVTDIAILVVAADDGVMPQTKEAISHAKAAGVAIIVAINKIDRPNANPERVKQELAENGLLVEEWGGDIIAVPVSAKKKENIDLLLEMVLLTADMLELKANPKKQAKGTVIEAQLDKYRGPVATLLVQRGTLRVGDAILSGSTFGHIRSMVNDKGKRIKEAGPSTPVEVIGLSEVPEAGDTFYVVTDEKLAKQLAEKRKAQQREKQIGRKKISLDDLFSQIQQGNIKELNLIVKADVQGSVEAICQSMEKLSNEEVKVNIVHSAVGSVTESDVKLAEVSNAIIIGFNVRPTANVTELAKNVGVDIRLYRIIYEAIEDMEKAMKGMLEPTYKEVVDGHAEVRKIFKASSIGTIGGCYVTDGKILRNSEVRVVRDGIVVYEGKLSSLKRFKDDVREVAAGYECGLTIERFNDIKEGDVIESFHMEEIARQ